jgi:SAM-dependent methyltransferase
MEVHPIGCLNGRSTENITNGIKRMTKIPREDVFMVGGIELTQIAEKYMALSPKTKLLSAACGGGELELYLCEKYGCVVTGVDASSDGISKAKTRTTARGLESLASFEVGDVENLRFEEEMFDVVFCSGALCAFLEKGPLEFHRVLKPQGKVVVFEVIWLQDDIPKEANEYWTNGGKWQVLTLTRHCQVFQKQGFDILLSEAYHEPSWWEAYHEDRSSSSSFQKERAQYLSDQEYIGVGLFILEKA